MTPLTRSGAQAIILAATLCIGGARAQTADRTTAQPAPAPAAAKPAGAPGLTIGPGGGSPIDIQSDGLDVFQPQHLFVFKGSVEAVQNDARLRTPELRVYTKDKTAAPGAKPSPAAPGAAPQMGSVDHMEAEGPVYYITPTENARGDKGYYVNDTDTITLTGNVVLVQGKSVGKGDKLVINRKTGESNLISFAPKDPRARVRVILYPQQQQPNGAAGAKPAPGAKS